MTTTIAITTSTDICGAAVGREGDVLASQMVVAPRSHAERLPGLLDAVSSQAEIPLGQIEAVAVDIGPGRFTGLRVGIAGALGLALANSATIFAVSSTEIVAETARKALGDVPLAVIIDAKRGEVFAQLFDSNGKPEGASLIVKPEELPALVEQRVCVGDGADLHSQLLGNVEKSVAGDPRQMIEMAKRVKSVAPAELAPNYMRVPDAVPNISTRGGDGK